jgi:phage-related minor tail protein
MEYGSDPPSKMSTYAQAVSIILYFIGLDMALALIILIKHVKDNWPFYKCSTNYMMSASLFGYDTEKNFQQCIQTMQTGYMTVLMEPANYLMSGINTTIGGLSSSLNDVRGFMNNFRTNLTGSIQNIFGVFVNMLTQIQVMVIKMKDTMSKTVGIMATLMNTMDASVQTMQSAWAGPIGATVRAL